MLPESENSIMKRKQSGFTLIEIAIVLVIIGLLLGGVLKGQELINSAKVKNLATDFRNTPVYIYGYQDKFKALPGDDANATSHLGTTICDNTGTTGCYNGDGNGVLGSKSATDNWMSTTPTDETQQFWIHVRLAGLAPGPTSGQTDYRPTNASGGFVGIQSGSTTSPPIKDKSGNPIRGSYVICSTGILGKFVTQLDTTMDDGNIGTGSMLAMKNYYFGGNADDPSASATAIDPAASYTVCMGV
jgi:prepilin-type N-terminal cleavage/methylation domain-containing protein